MLSNRERFSFINQAFELKNITPIGSLADRLLDLGQEKNAQKYKEFWKASTVENAIVSFTNRTISISVNEVYYLLNIRGKIYSFSGRTNKKRIVRKRLRKAPKFRTPRLRRLPPLDSTFRY